MRRVVLAIAIVLLAACGGDTRKPHQVLAEGRTALMAGDFARAQVLLELALVKADKAQMHWVEIKAYAAPLFQAYALQGKLEPAEKAFERVNRPPEELYIDPRAAYNLMALYARAGRLEDARRIADKLAFSLDRTSSNYTAAARFVYRGGIDRVLASAGNAEAAVAQRAKALMELQDLTKMHDSRYWPLEPGMKKWLAGYVSYLRGAGHAEDALQVTALVEKIEANSPSTGSEAPCIAVTEPPMLGCLVEL
jgi:tetratricopeptide (TPR) repeat protein